MIKDKHSGLVFDVNRETKIKPMGLYERILWASGILVVDLIIFFMPLMAIAAFAFILIRPPFVKKFVDRLYAGMEE